MSRRDRDEHAARRLLYGDRSGAVTPLDLKNPDLPTTEERTMDSGQITPAQACELARLVELHKPDAVALPLRTSAMGPIRVTLLQEPEDVRLVIDTNGNSWRDRQFHIAA